MTSFIPRKFKNLKTNETVDFEQVVQNSKISVILGEPASGKTYQLKIYNKKNKDISFILKSRHINNNKSQSQQIFLFDSIDEALTSYPTIKDDLLDYIENNPNKKFILTCRYLEWKKYFEKELFELDDKLKIYEILPLTDNDINGLIKEKSKPFWEFIDSNHLKLLLKNIMITLELVQNFEQYDKNSTYIDIYNEIIKKSITKVGEDREEENTDRSLEDLTLIASSLATYMTLNKKLSISSSNLNKLASECYKIEGKSLIADDLKAILNTALFEKKEHDFSFFHKSIQEYLTAYFINYKKLDFKTIKEIFAHKLRFYEEFEEVIIYLTNIEPKYFKYIVDFDPFIFRRHPFLNQTEQRKLLISVLHEIQYEDWMINSTKSNIGKWGTSRWRLLNSSSVFKYDKLLEEDLYNSVIKKIKKPISLTTFTFLIKLIEFNKNKNLEDYILKYLKKIPYEKQIEYISNGFELTATFVQESSFNLELFNFMKKNNFFDENFLRYQIEEKKRNKLDVFTAELIKVLYIQKDKCKDIDFHIIFNLRTTNSYGLSQVVPLLELEDSKKWLDGALRLYEKYGDSALDRCHPNWLIYSLLKNKISLGEILSFVDKYPWIERPFIDLRMLLNLKDIDNSFWGLFFRSNENEEKLIVLARILTYYRFDNLQKILEEYPIKKFLKSYFVLSKFFKIGHILKKDETFLKYLKENRNENY